MSELKQKVLTAIADSYGVTSPEFYETFAALQALPGGEEGDEIVARALVMVYLMALLDEEVA